MHSSKREATPDSGSHKRVLPLETSYYVVRRLSLIGPDGFNDVGACVLAVCCVEEKFENKKSRAGGDECV